MTESVDRQTAVLRLRGADDILILCHKNPDGDTIGCAGALYLALKALGKNAAILCSDPIPKMYDYMELRWFDGSFNPAFVVAVDVASIQLFGENNNVPQYAAHTNLCIDHHASNSGYAYETLLDPGAAAACEFLLDVIVDMGVTITPQIANCLYTGIATDTGCFKFASTTPRTHMAAARVMEAGADVEKLNARLFESRSHARITAERMAMESVQPYLAEGESTVGTRIEVKHVAATAVGGEVTCESELSEIDRRRLVFAVHVYDARGMVGEGTHERFIINNERFMAKLR